jgi:N-acyl-D-amino-acid deacylase
MFDIVIKGGRLVDGTGAAGRSGDVGIAGGVIVAVGDVVGPAKRTIDARGCLVTPGFVDVHTHYDAQATWDPWLTPSSLHGVTTAVMGNCGVGFAPAAPDQHDWLISLMESVEDIPGAALTEGMTWGFESFEQYLDVLGQRARVMDIGAQLPHGALRAYVMGQRGANNEVATEDDCARMRALGAAALRAGALGVSTSRTSLHKAANGEVMPGTHATREELAALCGAIADVGHGVFQGALEHGAVPDELRVLGALSKEFQCPISINLSQIVQQPRLWQQGLAVLNDLEREGARVVAQVAGRAIGIVMGLELTAHPLLATATYLELFHLPLAERVEALRNPAVRARLIDEEAIDLGEFANLITGGFERMYVAADDGTIDYEPDPSTSIAAQAARTGQSPRALALDALLRGDGTGKMYFPLFNYADGNLDLLHQLHQHPLTRMGLSDAGAHCGAICDGGMPTFMLTHWARDRSRGTLPLEHIIRRQTKDTAALYGLHDRGTLEVGQRADVNVIDFQQLRVGPVEVKYDLPAGGRRLLQRASGYRATLCAGVVTVENDAFTGALPGQLVRGPRKPSA